MRSLASSGRAMNISCAPFFTKSNRPIRSSSGSDGSSMAVANAPVGLRYDESWHDTTATLAKPCAQSGAKVSGEPDKTVKSQRFKCENCGAEQAYDATTGKLKCSHCGAAR